MNTAIRLFIASAIVMGTFATAAHADDQAKIDATLARLGGACKLKVMEKVKGLSMADVNVTVGATFQESIDSGAIDLKDLRKNGATYNWEVPSKGKSGYCNVNAKGKVTQFQKAD